LETDITDLLNAWRAGDQAALGQLSERVYKELRVMAHRHMKDERDGNTLQTTALVHEVYLRLTAVTEVESRQRAQFFAMAAKMMRHILVDAARARASDKRGAEAVHVNFDENAVVCGEADRSIVALDDALAAFAQIEELYHSAREASSSERAALLAQADPELRGEVESLLARQNDRMVLDHSIQWPGESGTFVFSPGVRLGPYEVESKIGEGGMGNVFRGIDTRLRRPVAIKFAHQRFTAHFEREARAISSLNIPSSARFTT